MRTLKPPARTKVVCRIFIFSVVCYPSHAMKQSRAIILIDGSNFYFKLRDVKLHHPLSFDFSKFASYLVRNDTVAGATYYVGAVRTDGTEKTNIMLANQQRLFAHLKKHKVTYSLGYLLKSNGVFHEKGVDVNIAVVILVAAYENRADTIYLVSSDTDLLPAVKNAQATGKTVAYFGFSRRLIARA